MNILLKFQDNTKDVVSVKLRQKINILDQFLFKNIKTLKIIILLLITIFLLMIKLKC